MTLDRYLQYTEDLKSKIYSLDLDGEDVRHGFYGLIYSSIYNFYIGKVSFELSKQISNGKVYFSGDIHYLEKHVNRLQEVSKADQLANGHNSALDRTLLLNSWTSFETCITLIFNHLTTENDIERIIKDLNNKIIKAISNFEDQFQTIIIDILKSSSFIPLKRKFNFIVKKGIENYGQELKEDRTFIELMGTMRNCIMHSNGIYFGKRNLTFNYYETEFEFINGQEFHPKGSNANVTWDLALRLVSIFDKLIKCIDYIEFIEHPKEKN